MSKFAVLACLAVPYLLSDGIKDDLGPMVVIIEFGLL